jgi:hypothetical protein
MSKPYELTIEIVHLLESRNATHDEGMAAMTYALVKTAVVLGIPKKDFIHTISIAYDVSRGQSKVKEHG